MSHAIMSYWRPSYRMVLPTNVMSHAIMSYWRPSYRLVLPTNVMSHAIMSYWRPSYRLVLPTNVMSHLLEPNLGWYSWRARFVFEFSVFSVLKINLLILLLMMMLFKNVLLDTTLGQYWRLSRNKCHMMTIYDSRYLLFVIFNRYICFELAM